MKTIKRRTRVLMAALAPASLFLLGTTSPAATQDPGAEHQQHAEHAKTGALEPTLLDQLAEIRASVARLEAALDRNHQATSSRTAAASSSQSSASMSSMTKPMGGMGKMSAPSSMQDSESMSEMKDMGSMGKMKMMQGMGKMGGKSMPASGAMSSDSSGGMGMKTGMKMGMGGGSMKRMQMMGRMGGMASSDPVATLSRLPGFPGASHIYHIGASGFFLDHGQHIELSMDQRKGLAQTQEKSSLEQSSFDRRISRAEQELWVLTSGGEPDASAIETKVREIAGLAAEQRLSFIRSVGTAAGILSEDQRGVLVGDLEDKFPEADGADGAADSPSDH